MYVTLVIMVRSIYKKICLIRIRSVISQLHLQCVTGTTIVISGSTTDNFSTKEPSGVIRGYDVNTGELLWIFDTGRRDPNAMPGSKVETLSLASPNAWAPLAYDAKT